MRSKITIWTQDGCSRCAAIADYFRANDHEVETRSAELADFEAEPAEIRRTVFADLQIQDGALPVVYIDGKYFDFIKFDKVMEEYDPHPQEEYMTNQ